MAENTAAAAEQMAMPKHGQICWSEIAVRDLDNCVNFYTELFGWKFKKSEVPEIEMQYHEFSNEETGCPIGGLYKMGEEFGDAPAHWMSYVAVDDVDAAAEKVKQLGGNVCVPPSDIPNVGRFCVVNDPSGATFSMIKLTPPKQS